MRRNSKLYATFFPLVNWACRLFYRNLHVKNSNKLCDTDAPVLLISNHQNALMDPLLCCISAPKQLNFLTRADVFKKSLAKKILFNLNMLPVYRPHDKVNIIESNAPTFRESLTRLENNQIISLFPEGTHQPDQNIRTFKKGAARLVGDVFDAGNSTKIIIQPIGLHFTNIMHSGYPAFVHYGEQLILEASDLDLAPENRSKMVLKLTNLFQETLTKYVVHLDDDENYSSKLFVFRSLQWSNMFSKRLSNVLEFKELEKQVPEHLHKMKSIDPQRIKDIENSSFDMPALVLAADEKLRKKFGKKLLTLIPIYLIGFVASAIPYGIGRKISGNMVKDVCFTSTAKIVLGAVLIPIFWTIILILLLLNFPLWISIISIVGIVFCGAIFLKYHTSYRMLSRANTIRNSEKYADLVSKVKSILN